MEPRSDKLLKKVLGMNGLILFVVACTIFGIFMFGDCAIQDFVVNRIGYFVFLILGGHLFLSIVYLYFMSSKDKKN